MDVEKNITGISENLSKSIIEKATVAAQANDELPLSKMKVAISISESEEIEDLGLSDYHLKDISIEIARYLIVNGAMMLYGGDLRHEGYTSIFSELANQYKYLKSKADFFVNYFPFPLSQKITLVERAAFKANQVKMELLPAAKTLGRIDLAEGYNPIENKADRYIIAECLSEMREKITSESNARILIGGRQKEYVGYMPGVYEEALYSIRLKQPIYLIGGFGGVTKSIISLILNKKSDVFTNEFQFSSTFLMEFKEYSKMKSSTTLDYDALNAEIAELSLEIIANRNGLSIEENQILFESTNIHELVFLIIKGLLNLSAKK